MHMKIQKTDADGEIYFIETDEPEALMPPIEPKAAEERIEAIQAIVKRKTGRKSDAQRAKEYRLRLGDNYRQSHAKYMQDRRLREKQK